MMLTGLLIIVFGVLVAVFPQILVAMVSTALIATGLGICLMSWRFRRLQRGQDSASVKWFLRF